MSKPKTPAPPSHLSAEAREMFRNIHNEREIADEIGRRHVLTACEAMDRMRDAQSVLRREGTHIRDHNGVPRPHPAIQIEKISRSAMLNALRSIGM